MSKLMRAYLVRLRKEKSLWLFLAVMLVLSLLIIRSGILLDLQYPEDETYVTLESCFFGSVPYIGVLCSVVISLFLGVEYSDGTIRNKLVTGHKRNDIYLSSLLTSIIIAEMFALAWFLGGLAGIPHFGLWTMETKRLLLYVLLVVLSTAALAAIFHFIGMLITNRAISVVAAIFVALGMLLMGSMLYNKLCEPEMTLSGMVITENGVEFGDEIPNPSYVGGTARVIYGIILNALPQGQEILLANYDDMSQMGNPTVAIMGSLLILLVITAVGITIFRKKDLK